MAFFEFARLNKGGSGSNLNKSSSEDVLHHGINKNVAKLFNESGVTHGGNPMGGAKQEKTLSKAIQSQDKRNSKSEENIFEKFEFGHLTKSSSNDNTLDKESHQSEGQKVISALRSRLKFRNSSDELNPSPKRSDSLEDQSTTSEATSSTEFLENEAIQAARDTMPQSGGVITDAQGLIVPKKLVNPCLESHSHQSLHRELLFNQKVGKTVLNQKSELQRALEKQKERQMLAAQTQQKKEEQSIENELNKVIMQRQARLENSQKENNKQNELDHFISPEYLNARAKLKHTIDTK